MARLIVFDLDGTLAGLGKGITSHNVEMLRCLEKKGHRIALCSGKPSYYLCGLLRQVELKNPVMLGENGGDVMFGIDLPPKETFRLPYSKSAKADLREMKNRFEQEIPGMWYQPNEIVLTPFFRSEAERDRIREMIDDARAAGGLSEVDIFEHCDCFDLVPKGVNKYEGVKALAAYLGFDAKDVIAVGDGCNDLPMFRFAGLSIGIAPVDPEYVDQHFSSIDEAMDYLLHI